MPVSIKPVEAADIAAFARLQLEAFASHPRTPMMWRKGYTDQVYAYHESKTTESLRDPECRLIKAVDDETGAMVGVSEITFALNIETNRNQRPVGEDDSPTASVRSFRAHHARAISIDRAKRDSAFT